MLETYDFKCNDFKYKKPMILYVMILNVRLAVLYCNDFKCKRLMILYIYDFL